MGKTDDLMKKKSWFLSTGHSKIQEKISLSEENIHSVTLMYACMYIYTYILLYVYTLLWYSKAEVNKKKANRQ